MRALYIAILGGLAVAAMSQIGAEPRATFVLLNNTPTGQVEVMRVLMLEKDCLEKEKQVWAIDWPLVGRDEEGREIPVTDAACLP